jgi:hypothetical protein
MSGIRSPVFRGKQLPGGVPNPTRKAVPVRTGTSTGSAVISTSTSGLVYARRYLDWNRLTFIYHTAPDRHFDLHSGLRVSSEITEVRKALGLQKLFGCAPTTYCQYCQPFGAPGNIYTLVEAALATVVVNESRIDFPRLILNYIGSIRFDLLKGPFTLDDSYTVSPFNDAFQFIPNVPYSIAKVKYSYSGVMFNPEG